MNPIVNYKSKYGSTKQYAAWIAEELGCLAVDAKDIKIDDLQKYDTIIYGGGPAGYTSAIYTSVGTEKEILADGVFVSIGRCPKTELFCGQLDVDKNGYITADETTKNSISGVFAVGDVRTKPIRQIVTAATDRAYVSHFAEEYLANNYGM